MNNFFAGVIFMKTIEYIVKDELGLHARPAGLLVKKVGAFQSKVTIGKDGQKADAKRLFAVMGLAVKQNDTIVIEVEGADEEQAAAEIQAFCEQNF